MAWHEVAAEKQRLRAAAIESVLPSMTGQEPDGTATADRQADISTLTRRIEQRETTAEAVTRAYIQRAIAAQDETNCLSEPLFCDALQQARELDLYFKKNGKLIGPLHGIPISLKDQFNVKEFDTTLGYVGRSFRPADHDATMVVLLKKLGAVIITKTTIPQSILWGETESPLWGLTTYPGDSSLTPGGSSGGEASLLAMRGSLCGWGTDIGGSIRGPSHFCGHFGLKPSSSRFPYAGVPVSHDGQTHVPSSIGPMAQQLSTLIDMTRACLQAQPWILDPHVTPLPWREDDFQNIQGRPLKVGVILDDGVVRPHPEIELAVRFVSGLLERANHVLIPWSTVEHMDCIEIMDKFYRADGGDDIRNEVQIAGEPLIPHVAALVESAKPISVFQYWQLNRQKVAAQQAYNRKWNESSRLGSLDKHVQADHGEQARAVDVIISPVIPHTAVPHRTSRWVGYTKIWNFLDYTAMSFPITNFGLDFAEKNWLPGQPSLSTLREHYQQRYSPRNPMDEWNYNLYNPEAMQDLPIGIQIIGRRFDEEKVLGIASLLQRLAEEHYRSKNV